MPAIGQTISHYRIVEKIGEGGMGQVFLADDTTLDRKVALKFLPDTFTGDPERMARFEREAKLLASLNHTNIAGIYGLEQADGSRFLVLEYVEGETLQARLAQGALPLEDALELCRQIAEGLESAHEKGVIHRDLKPANVMITADEKVKILDFGLAKALSDDTQSIDSSQSPTLTEAMTRPGIILGTAAYMSPEQAKGKSADKRADIWAFGCILYECLTGKKAFEGETVTETLAAILRGDPDWHALPDSTPSDIKVLMRRCLNKNAKQRIHDAADARIELEEARSAEKELSNVEPGMSSMWKPSGAVLWTIVVLLAATVILLIRHQLHDTASGPERPVRFSIRLPEELKFSDYPVISPDGSRLAFVARKGNTLQIYVRFMEQSEAFPIPGTEGAEMLLCFSPDGKWIAFRDHNELKKVSLEGGSPQALCQTSFVGGAWGNDGSIIYTPSYSLGLWRIPSSGGDPVKLTEPESSRGELGHWWPQILPDGDTILFTNYVSPVERCSIAAYSLKTHKQKTLVEGAMFGHYIPTGHIVYVHAGTLFAIPFDAKSLEKTGAPVQVLDDVAVDFMTASAGASISDNGTIAYIRASSVFGNYRLVRIDRKGNIQPVTDVKKDCDVPRLSPDGRRIAMTCAESGKAADIWTYDLDRGTFTRITSGAGLESTPLWTRNGERLIFQSEHPQFDLYWKAADGTGSAEPLITSPFDKRPGTMSRDGKTLIYSEFNPETRNDLWVLPMEGEREPRLWLQTSFNETMPALSPNGKWLAYVSDDSRRNEVYIQPFPDHGERKQVSVEGGDMPLWAPNGRELFYWADNRIMSVSVTTDGTLKIGNPVAIFDYEEDYAGHRMTYDISPDGTWFVGMQRDPMAPPDEVEVVLNWFEELKHKVPVP
jgi:serine/threonine protein kinase/WD40 repeat protein